MRDHFVAVVVAGGAGTRLGARLPKALTPLGGRPLVGHAVDRMLAAGAASVVVVAPPTHRQQFADLLPQASVVDGGAERQQSVLAGLEAIGEPAPSVVLVHDAARPLVPLVVIDRVVEAVRTGARAVVPVLPVADTIRRVSADGSELVDRAELRAVQTPQGFDRVTLLAAHRRFADTPVTDDAALCELAGEPVHLVDGSPDSLKITRPLDVVVAEAIWDRAGDREERRDRV